MICLAENLIKAIDRWGIETPTKIAYDYLGKTNTYAELKAYSDRSEERRVGKEC